MLSCTVNVLMRGFSSSRSVSSWDNQVQVTISSLPMQVLLYVARLELDRISLGPQICECVAEYEWSPSGVSSLLNRGPLWDAVPCVWYCNLYPFFAEFLYGVAQSTV